MAKQSRANTLLLILLLFIFLSLSLSLILLIRYSIKERKLPPKIDALLERFFIERNIRELSNILNDRINENLSQLIPEEMIEERREFREVGYIRYLFRTKIFHLPKGISVGRCYRCIKKIVGEGGVAILDEGRGEEDGYKILSLTLGIPPLYEMYSLIFRKKVLPKIAVIIDDLGYFLDENIYALLEMKHPITLAILPGLTYTREIAELAESRDVEVMVHLPMEPHGYPGKNPGPCAILSGMTRLEVEEILDNALEEIKNAKGISNHMGSKITEEEEIVSIILDKIRRDNLYFIDSLTTSKSIVKELAEEYGVKFESRDIFLDNGKDEEYVREQFLSLVEIAKKEGYAIGIGHIQNPSTISVLKEILPKIEESDIEIVSVSEIFE